MASYLMKATILTFLTTIIFSFTATANPNEASPSIELVDLWPDDIGHGDEVYVDAQITDEGSVENAWFVVNLNGERVGTGTLVDSNNDQYYVSPVAFEARGGKSYKIIVKSCDRQFNCGSKEVCIQTACELSALDRCLY